MNLFTSPSKYSLQVQLPLSICPEMVTISANKGDKLKVIANAWHIEHGSRYEWNIAFPPRDVNISDVQAKFDTDGRLTIDVHRIVSYAR
ncbi:hypothetical protein BD779DRAFT_1433094 [Infundibulicybe gibba]|nr:hypothetical protein BD779DRAFT_1433094 [Infundibulicybe gibba]